MPPTAPDLSEIFVGPDIRKKFEKQLLSEETSRSENSDRKCAPTDKKVLRETLHWPDVEATSSGKASQADRHELTFHELSEIWKFCSLVAMK